jgi:hypothetical protein
MRVAVIIGLLIVVLAGCQREATLDQAARQSVAVEARELLAATPPGDGADVSIPPASWGKAIKSLEPRNVRADAMGLRISVGSFMVEEWGYFVPRNEAAFSPMVGGDPSYRGLGDGVYWFEVKG